jgi:hypothetical protein
LNIKYQLNCNRNSCLKIWQHIRRSYGKQGLSLIDMLLQRSCYGLDRARWHDFKPENACKSSEINPVLRLHLGISFHICMAILVLGIFCLDLSLYILRSSTEVQHGSRIPRHFILSLLLSKPLCRILIWKCIQLIDT